MIKIVVVIVIHVIIIEGLGLSVCPQVVATAVLLLVILSLNDSRNNEPPAFLKPILIGTLVLVIGVAMGSNCGYAINPARDFGPRLFSYLVGYGSQVFTAGDSWWWVPIVAPVLGGLLGCFLYKILIEIHHDDPEEHSQQPAADLELCCCSSSS
uniref:Aquaporin-9-like n=1 Tax=Callorhinchus milii TaxID=7868 RepID=A0A4W3GU75_CALMI